MKECYNIRNFPKPLKKYLEKVTGGTLTKIRLIFPNEDYTGKDIPFYRFRLEGIQDHNVGNRKIGNRFMEMYPALVAAYPNSLLRVCREIGWQDLILDFSSEMSIFQDFCEPGFKACLDLSPEELYPLQAQAKILDILPPKKVLRRIRKNGDPN